jgi:hypothetical protein
VSKCPKCGKEHGTELKWLYEGGVARINDPVLQVCIVLDNYNKLLRKPNKALLKDIKERLDD